MPPKAKLPRRSKAKQNELNLEAVSEERIDAVTAEPLDPVKYIEVLSPDQTLRLFYNTSTLIRIAVDKGGFMQPPHFREPMSNTLRKKIEDIEGKKFHFEAHNSVMSTDEIGDGAGIAVMHRHVYFDQIMDEFYLLNPAEVYVCPVCYEHYMKTRYLPALLAERRTVRHLRNGTPVVDPLDVLSSMHGEDTTSADGGDAPIVLGAAWDNVLVHVVFRKAAHWKAHMEKHHEVTGIGAADYRLRDVLCTYYNDYNTWNEEKYEDDTQQYGDGKKRAALTQQRYWHINASYNRLRYNRVVAAVELAEGHPEAVAESGFPNETIAHHFNPEYENDDDFIDDEESDDEDYIPPYSPTHEGFDVDSMEEEEDEQDVADEKVSKATSRKRRREQSVASDSSTSDSESSLSSASTSSDSAFAAAVDKQRSLFKRGLLAERDCYYSRLSAEDRHFVERSQRSTVAPSQLYDPRMHQVRSETETLDDVTDWENIGEALPIKKTEWIAKDAVEHRAPKMTPRMPARAALLLDEDEVQAEGHSAQTTPVALRKSRLLLDEDD